MSRSSDTVPAPPPCVLVFSGSDPSGGAGLQADMAAIAALGAHPFSVPTVLTVQDNETVFGVYPVAADLVRQQAQVLIDRFRIDAVKLGVLGNRANAEVIAELIRALRRRQPRLPVVLDPVLANGHGDRLSADEPVSALEPLFSLATLMTPNRIEARRLCAIQGMAAAAVPTMTPVAASDVAQQGQLLLRRGCGHVLLKGGHGPEREVVVNHLIGADGSHARWFWPRLAGEFHGSGCTLAAAIAALLARGLPMAAAVAQAQQYCQRALAGSYALAPGQRFPSRTLPFLRQPMEIV